MPVGCFRRRWPRGSVAADSAWVKNPIDAFVLAKLEEKGYSPAPRRVETRAIATRLFRS